MKKIYILPLCLLLGCLTGCFDLDKTPEGVLSTSAPFASTGEMRNYLDQFYQVGASWGSGMREQAMTAGGGSGIAGGDVHSDNLSSNTVSTRLAGESSLASASSLKQYTAIRNLNFFLNNLDNCSEQGSATFNQYVGEAYYFRAWFYYQLFVNYGPLTWIDTPLDPDIELMKLPRQGRGVVTDHILADLDRAAELLEVRNNSASMRIHRDVARALQSEVALFEATWEKYHKAKNTPFHDPEVSAAKITQYLETARRAAEEVISRGAWAIYSTGDPTNDYRRLFQTADLSANKEVLWFKRYDGDQVGNNVNRYLNQGGGGIGVTASLVDDYLTRDGRPFVGEEKLQAKKVYGQELDPALRDPRLCQTVARPGQVMRPDEPQGVVMPPLIGSSAYNQNVTGYSLLKHVQIDYTGNLDAEFKGATPAIQFRYADVLLDYAEALAELGGATHSARIVEALKPLRQRAGMPDVDFDREYNTAADYPFRALDKYIQAVRRERRVEQACEGRRLQDILRWAAAEELIIGQWPQGALYTGSNLENHPHYGGRLVHDQASGNNLHLSGTPADALRYILPIDPAGHPHGLQFRPDRDYLLPIQPRMLGDLTGGEWKQNPGW